MFKKRIFITQKITKITNVKLKTIQAERGMD